MGDDDDKDKDDNPYSNDDYILRRLNEIMEDIDDLSIMPIDEFNKTDNIQIQVHRLNSASSIIQGRKEITNGDKKELIIRINLAETMFETKPLWEIKNRATMGATQITITFIPRNWKIINNALQEVKVLLHELMNRYFSSPNLRGEEAED